MLANRGFGWGMAVVAMIALGIALTASLGCTKKTTETIITTGPGPTAPTSTTLAPGQDLPGIVINILSVGGGSGSNGNVRAGDTVSLTFTLKKNDGSNLSASELDSSTAVIAGPSFNYQKLGEAEDWHDSARQNADGSWTFTFPSAVPSTYPLPENAGVTAGDDELRGQAPVDGTYTVGLMATRNYFESATTFIDGGSGTRDFLFGGASTIAAREAVKNDNCNQCHVSLRFHDGAARDTKMCVLCHTAGANDLGTPGVSIEFKVMIHKIHNGKHLPSVLGVSTNVDGTRNYGATPTPYEVTGEAEVTDFSEVGFPVWPSLSHAMPKNDGYSLLGTTQKTADDSIRLGVVACSMCHGTPLSGGAAPAQGSLAFSQPSRRACGSCHDDVVWTNPYKKNTGFGDGGTMPAQTNDSGCTLCHPTTGSTIATEDAHLHPLDDSTIDPGVKFDITALSGGTGGIFQIGDSPTITFTIKNDAGTTDISPTSLDSASMLVVGPTTNRQNVMPYPGAASNTITPFDFSGRLASGSTTGKGSMSRTIDAASDQVIFVDFTSATAFNVTGFVAGGPNDSLGSASLPASPSTNPLGSSIGGIVLTSAAVAQQIQVAFTSAVDFDVQALPGPVSMGTGKLPGTLSCSTRFVSTDGSVAFNVSVGTNAFANGNKIYLTVFKGAVANPVVFAIVAGRTSFSTGDRFYSEAIAPAANYTMKVPMDITLEYLDDGSGAAGQNLTAAHTPVYYGRQTVWEVTALGASTTLSANAAPFSRFITVASTAAFASTNSVVLQPGAGIGTTEFVQIGLVEGAPLNRLWFNTPLRYAHASGTTVQLATLTFRQETASYTLNPATGTITSVVAFGAGNPIVMSYRTDGKFGYKRHNGDTTQAVYQPPINDSPDQGQDWGEWTGLPYLDGTYTVGIWGYQNVELPLNGEAQTYRSTSVPSLTDFLFGTATTIVPHRIISAADNCNSCHKDVMFHGGGRRSFDSCVLCHSLPGSEDRPRYSVNGAPATTGVTIDFRTMLHKIHKGEDLANASTYTVVGFGSPPVNFTAHTYGEIVFPAMPGKTRHCSKCHGSSNAWQAPAARSHPGQTTPTRRWRSVCSSCHDSTDALAHIELNTFSGLEACQACHGIGHSENVALLHHNR